MKIFLAILIGFLLSTSAAQAKTAWYFDQDRSGEGIILTEIDDGRIAFAFYSHTAVGKRAPPVASPAKPKHLYCDEKTVWLTGLTYINDGEVAEGNVYYDVPVPIYPVSVEGNVSESVSIGTFFVWKEGDGFTLLMDNNHIFCDLSVFGVEHHFVTKLVE